ncbi:hypothetical protein QR98_0089920, partial [Sarcoptes scabiei]
MFCEAVVQDALTELGVPQQRKDSVNILFCRDTFNHEALLQNDLNCDHLAPKLTGRPRKRLLKYRKTIRSSSPESISSDENVQQNFAPRRSRRTTAQLTIASNRTLFEKSYKRSKQSTSIKQKKRTDRTARGNNNSGEEDSSNRSDKENKPETNLENYQSTKSNQIDDVDMKIKNDDEDNVNLSSSSSSPSNSIDANNNIDDDTSESKTVPNNPLIDWKIPCRKKFLNELKQFMKKRGTPIQRIPILGAKKLDLHTFFNRVVKFGGYEETTKQRLWKKLYIDLSGDRSITSAATCARRHYEKLLLPFERFLCERSMMIENGSVNHPKAKKRGRKRKNSCNQNPSSKSFKFDDHTEEDVDGGDGGDEEDNGDSDLNTVDAEEESSSIETPTTITIPFTSSTL